MTRRTVARLVVRTLPRAVAAGRGAEIEGTLLDAGEQSRGAFVTEAASVLGAGLAARVRGAGGQPVTRMARDVLGWTAVLTVARLIVAEAWFRVELHPAGLPAQSVWLQIVLPLVILLLWSIGSMRSAGLAGVIWAAWSLAAVSLSARPNVLLNVKVALVGFLVLVARPARPRPRARLLWLLPVALSGINLFPLSIAPWAVLSVLIVVGITPLAPAFGLGGRHLMVRAEPQCRAHRPHRDRLDVADHPHRLSARRARPDRRDATPHARAELTAGRASGAPAPGCTGQPR